MAYIAPNTDLEFFPDLGLSPSHENTFYFATTAAKDTYFGSLTKLATASQCYYQREQRGWARVEIPMSQLIGAGYMRFKNTLFENKWFYAFVLDVEMINNQVTEVHFAIDNLMTWMGTYVLGQCFVEREHTLSDNIGEHLIDEGTSIGDYVNTYIETITPYSPVLIMSSTVHVDWSQADPDPEVKDSDGAFYKGYIASGTEYAVYDLTSAPATALLRDDIKAIIKAQKSGAIVSMRIVPAYCAPVLLDYIQAAGVPLDSANGGDFLSAYTLTQLDGYTPANKKMFSYPYITYEVINGEGCAAEFRLEFFTNTLKPSFQYRGISVDNCEVTLIPTGYKNLGYAWDEAMMMRSFPQASWNIDQYAAYIAQLSSGGGWISIASSIANRIANYGSRAAGQVLSADEDSIDEAGLGMASGLVGAASGIITDTLKVLQDNIYYDSLPPIVKGQSNANISSSIGKKQFIGTYKTITSERARSIDRYFTMYGYKVNMVKTPSCNNRPHFTYVKTVGCIVHGNLPASAAAEIERIFDNGVRFWMTPSEIGDYTVNNAPGV